MSNNGWVLVGLVLGAAITWTGIMFGRWVEWRVHRDLCVCEHCRRFRKADSHKLWSQTL